MGGTTGGGGVTGGIVSVMIGGITDGPASGTAAGGGKLMLEPVNPALIAGAETTPLAA